MAKKYRKARYRRVYLNDGSWYWVIPGTNQWIRLCRESDSEDVLLERLAAVKRKHERLEGVGDMRQLIDQFVKAKEAEHRDKTWPWFGRTIGNAFRNANVADVEASDIIRWLKTKYESKLSMQGAMRAFLSTFFQWCLEEGIGGVKNNPCREIRLKKPSPRKTYIEHAHFIAIRTAMLQFTYQTASGKVVTQQLPDGPVMQCFVDLCYFTAQRSTEIRNLKWHDVDESRGTIRFVPSKTLRSSGVGVDFKITPEINEVLDRVRALDLARGVEAEPNDFVLHHSSGKALSVVSTRQAWERALTRIDLPDLHYTVKDIRAKALTDARHAGYSRQELMVAAAHSNERMTEVYIKQKIVPVTDVRLRRPSSEAESAGESSE